MRVEDKPSIKTADSGPSKQTSADRTVSRTQTDKVTVEGPKQVEAVVQAVQASLGVDRAARLQELETAIRRGGYQPDAGQLAEKIVQAAEVDARVRAIFGG
jgi:anti-sigma28 factor (negative regulator of flagellin synthesis)